MNKHLKTIGKGFIYGAFHPFDEEIEHRHDDMSAFDSVLDGTGIMLAQGIVRSTLACAVSIALISGLELLDSAITNTSLKVDEVKKDK